MGLHAPSKGWFIASLIIAVIALIVRCRQFQFHTSLRMEFGLPWLGLFLMPETRQNSIWEEAAAVKA
jgi:hypothetical protein